MSLFSTYGVFQEIKTRLRQCTACPTRHYGLQIAALFWGLWLFPMGYAIVKSGYIPRILGILLIIACFRYLFDSFTALLFPDLSVTVEQFTFIGELLLPLWLLTKGVNIEQWQKQALDLA